MRLVIKNSIQLCLRTLVFSIVLRDSNYNNRIISIEGTFFWDTLYRDKQTDKQIIQGQTDGQTDYTGTNRRTNRSYRGKQTDEKIIQGQTDGQTNYKGRTD